MDYEKMKIVTFLVLITTVILLLILSVLDLIADRCANSKPVEQPPGIFLDDQRINRVYIIKDTRRNLQWDAVGIGHAIVILPGTEKPIKTSP